MVLAAAFILMLAPVPYGAPEPERPPTVAGYLTLCETDAKACADRLFDLVWERSVGEQKVGFCLPDTGTPQEVAARVAGWLAARPELADAPFDDGLIAALEATYRC